MSREKPLIAKLSELDRKLFQVRFSCYFFSQKIFPAWKLESIVNLLGKYVRVLIHSTAGETMQILCHLKIKIRHRLPNISYSLKFLIVPNVVFCFISDNF